MSNLQVYQPAEPFRWEALKLQGPDAADYLHRLTTVNVKALAIGAGAPGFFLNAQGKIRAFFHLWKISAEEFFFEFDPGRTGEWKKELLDVIEQFHFAEQFRVEVLENQKALWVLGEKLERTGDVQIFDHSTLSFGTNWSTVWGEPSQLEAFLQTRSAKQLSTREIEQMRIENLEPRVDAELTFNINPLEAGLIRAISSNKGCYPGQEVIEKIISLGSPAKRLVKLEGTGKAPSSGEPILDSHSSSVGTVTSSIEVDAGFHALGFVRKTHSNVGEKLEISNQSAVISKVSQYK